MAGTVLMDLGGAGLAQVVSDALLIGGGVVVVSASAAIITTVIAVRRIRRSAGFALLALRLQVLTRSGPRREVARMRLQLRRAVDGGRTSLLAGGSAAGLPGEAPALFRRIEREAQAVDAHLRVMQTEDDPASLRTALPALRSRVEETTGLVRQLRSAVADGLAAMAAATAGDLRADVEREVVALRAGRERLQHAELRADRPWTDEGATR